MTTAVATIEPVQFLANVQGARDLLAGATELPDIKKIRDKASALQQFARSADIGLEAQNFAAILKIEAERKAGELLKGFGKKKNQHAGNIALPALAELGISKMKSSRWQRMAEVSDEHLTELIDKCNAGNREVTSAAVLKLAQKTIVRKPQPVLESDSAGVVNSLDTLIESGQRFSTIYADPPWQYDNQATRASTDMHYTTMSVADIAALPVDLLADESAILFLWTTNGFLFESQKVIDAWGFEFKSSMVWIKPEMGIGNYVRNSHEFLLIATRGGAMPTDARKKQQSWVSASRGKHSAKPGAFRRIVESLGYPNRLELFGRSKAEGWVVFGNQFSRGIL